MEENILSYNTWATPIFHVLPYTFARATKHARCSRLYRSPKVAKPGLLSICQVQEIAIGYSIIVSFANLVSSLVLPDVVGPTNILATLESEVIEKI